MCSNSFLEAGPFTGKFPQWNSLSSSWNYFCAWGLEELRHSTQRINSAVKSDGTYNSNTIWCNWFRDEWYSGYDQWVTEAARWISWMSSHCKRICWCRWWWGLRARREIDHAVYSSVASCLPERVRFPCSCMCVFWFHLLLAGYWWCPGHRIYCQ